MQGREERIWYGIELVCRYWSHSETLDRACGLAWGSPCIGSGFEQHFPQGHGSCKVSSDLCSAGQDAFLLPCYRVPSSLLKWPQQALCQHNPQQLFAIQPESSRTPCKTVSRRNSAGGYWSTWDLQHWSNVESPTQELQYAKMNKSGVKLPLPSADYKNPLEMCQQQKSSHDNYTTLYCASRKLWFSSYSKFQYSGLYQQKIHSRTSTFTLGFFLWNTEVWSKFSFGRDHLCEVKYQFTWRITIYFNCIWTWLTMHKFETVKLTNSFPKYLFLRAILCFCCLSENIILPRKQRRTFHQICLLATLVTTQVINGPCVLQEYISYEAAHHQPDAVTKNPLRMHQFRLERTTEDFSQLWPPLTSITVMSAEVMSM